MVVFLSSGVFTGSSGGIVVIVETVWSYGCVGLSSIYSNYARCIYVYCEKRAGKFTQFPEGWFRSVRCLDTDEVSKDERDDDDGHEQTDEVHVVRVHRSCRRERCVVRCVPGVGCTKARLRVVDRPTDSRSELHNRNDDNQTDHNHDRTGHRAKAGSTAAFSTAICHVLVTHSPFSIL